MKLISSSDAVTFLSQAAPKPWVQRLLRWMAFDEGLTAYSTHGTVRPFASVGRFTAEYFKEAGEFSGAKMDAVIRKHYSPEFAEKLVGREHGDRVDDAHHSWDASDDPLALDIGFFLYATEIDWDKGSLIAELIPGRGELNEVFFPSSDLLNSEFEDANYDAEVEGLSFEFGKIELLLPNFELRRSAGFVTDSIERPRARGRPLKWDWEGALAFIVAHAHHPDGLPTGPGAQARIEEMIAGWFIDQTGASPAPSQVRERAGKIVRMLEKPKLSVAE